MGLDSVEILMKVEDTFRIKIPDQEAEQILTVGDFHNTVWRHLSGKHSDKCKSQLLFYKLRKSFADTFNFSPQQLTPDTSPEEIFPITNRRQAYLNFADTANLKFPDLVLTKPWTKVLTTFGFATILGGLITSLILINLFDFSKWTLLIPVVSIILTIFLSSLLNPKRTKIKEITIREFTQHTLALNYSTLIISEGTNRQEIENVINDIIADMAGLDLEVISSEKKIADDLGID
jgi:acyl carrier protein